MEVMGVINKLIINFINFKNKKILTFFNLFRINIIAQEKPIKYKYFFFF